MATLQPGRPSRRLATLVILRLCVVTAAMFWVYATVPLGERPEGRALVGLLVSLLVLAVVVVWQVYAVMRSPFPRLRAVEAVTVSVPLLLLSFSVCYFVTGQTDPGSFNETLTRVDAFYFSVTVFATVGFGDIVATSTLSRVQVTAQMIADLVLIGLIAKVLVGAAQRRRQALDAERAARESDPAPDG